MSNTLNQLVCASKYGNTGAGDCYLDPKKIEGYILVPGTWGKTASQIAAGLKAALQADTYAVVGTRIFPVHNIVAVNDGSEEPVVESLGYGAKKVVREGFLDWKFELSRGGMNLHKNLRKFNGNAVSVLFYDSDGTIFGYDNNGVFSGIPTQFFWQNPIKINNGQNVTKYVSQFSFAPKYLNDFFAYVTADFDLTLVKGLINVPLVLKTLASNVATITLVAEQGGIDLAVLYSAAMTTSSNWTATRLDTGVTVSITSVAANAGGGVDVTLNSAAFTALPSGTQVSVNLVSASALNTAGVIGYEGVAVIVTKP